MFYRVDQTTLPSEVDCAGLPSTPCIVVCGNSTLAAENFMLSVDQTIVNGHIRIFSEALMLMFGSYYCMNISYPATQASTLEFLQRCLFKINPDKGSKVERNTNKKQLAVSPTTKLQSMSGGSKKCSQVMDTLSRLQTVMD
ncbi:uncharacterized protein LOC125019143 isoform X2 [Mugil cephalus]|nr:uncharacterized protein LOC125019143 isoform X2 [Mugil cephalus]